MTKQVILINGLKRSGKDYSASLMKQMFEDRGMSVELISFAGPMKRIIAKTFEISEAELDIYKNEQATICLKEDRTDLTNFRRILQRFGNEAMKPEFGDEVWADIGCTKALESKADIVIMPDFRFDTEYNKFNRAKGNFEFTSVYVQGPEKESSDTHSSEQKPNVEFSAELNNIAQDESLTEYVRMLVENILQKDLNESY